MNFGSHTTCNIFKTEIFTNTFIDACIHLFNSELLSSKYTVISMLNPAPACWPSFWWSLLQSSLLSFLHMVHNGAFESTLVTHAPNNKQPKDELSLCLHYVLEGLKHLFSWNKGKTKQNKTMEGQINLYKARFISLYCTRYKIFSLKDNIIFNF